jgi:uncharacterized RDD family membrane protein YckC
VAEVAAPDPPNTSMESASLGDRFLASIIDGIIYSVILILCALALYAVGFIRSFEDFVSLGTFASLMLSFAVYAFYIGINWKLLSTTGQTIGKKAMKIRVVTRNGRLPSMFDQVVKRYGFFTFIAEIPVVGPFISLINILFIFGRERRCLHDLIAGTRVIKAHP